MTGMTIDFETADKITLLNLKDALATMEKEVKDHIETGSWMHPEDLHEATFTYMPALKVLIKYYGGSYE